MLHESILSAYKVLEGAELDRETAAALLRLKGPDLLDLISLANKVRLRFAAEPHLCSIVNAKSGACPEDCRYCAQSLANDAPSEVFPLVSEETILAAAGAARENGALCFCIVTSGRGYPEENFEFRRILAAADAVRARYPDLNLGASLGNLSGATARALADHGVTFYNHNLQVNPARYGDLVATTHGAAERMETIRHLKACSVRVCSGGIFGLGESAEDRLELALALKALDVDVVPLNVLIPIPGTPLQDQDAVTMPEVAKALALFRLVLPRKVIKFAAGRETRCRDFQGLLLLSGPNGFLTGGYLTTRGRPVAEDRSLLHELGEFDAR